MSLNQDNSQKLKSYNNEFDDDYNGDNESNHDILNYNIDTLLQNTLFLLRSNRPVQKIDPELIKMSCTELQFTVQVLLTECHLKLMASHLIFNNDFLNKLKPFTDQLHYTQYINRLALYDVSPFPIDSRDGLFILFTLFLEYCKVTFRFNPKILWSHLDTVNPFDHSTFKQQQQHFNNHPEFDFIIADFYKYRTQFAQNSTTTGPTGRRVATGPTDRRVATTTQTTCKHYSQYLQWLDEILNYRHPRITKYNARYFQLRAPCILLHALKYSPCINTFQKYTLLLNYFIYNSCINDLKQSMTHYCHTEINPDLLVWQTHNVHPTYGELIITRCKTGVRDGLLKCITTYKNYISTLNRHIIFEFNKIQV